MGRNPFSDTPTLAESERELDLIRETPTAEDSVDIYPDLFLDSHLDQAFSELSRMPNLRTVVIRHLRKRLPTSITTLVQIHTLEIDTCICTDPHYLPEEIGALSSLEQLSIYDSADVFIPDSLSQLKNLKRLILSQTGAANIPASLWQLGSLENLTLDGGVRQISPQLGGMNSLRQLDLTGSFSEFPVEMAHLDLLEQLSLNGNFIEFPSSLISSLRLRLVSLRGKVQDSYIGSFEEDALVLEPQAVIDYTEKFSADSRRIWEEKQANSLWPLYRTASDAARRPLVGVPVISSYRIVGLPTGEVELRPVTSVNVTAGLALIDKSPVVFVPEQDPNQESTIENYADIGVMAELIASSLGDTGHWLKFRCLERVRVSQLRRVNDLVLADIDVFEGQREEPLSTSLVDEVQRLAMERYEAELQGIKTTKRERKNMLQDFQRDVQRSVLSNQLADTVSVRLMPRYEDRLRQLYLGSESERLSTLRSYLRRADLS